MGGSVAEWLGRRRLRVKFPVTTKLELFLARPKFNSSVILVNGQLVCLPPFGIFKPINPFSHFKFF